jgi:tryptophan-rich sensory protein
MSSFLSNWQFWLYLIIVLIVLIIETIITIKGLKNPTYQNFQKPSIQPRSIVFSIAWLILFGIIIYAWYESTHVAESKNVSTTTLQILFGLNLLLNFLWVVVFFYKFDYKISLFILVLLVIETIALIVVVSKYSTTAAILLGIYLLWLLFATYLNYQYLILNNEVRNSYDYINIRETEKVYEVDIIKYDE